MSVSNILFIQATMNALTSLNVHVSYSGYHYQDNVVIPGVNAHSCGIDVLF